MDIFFITLAAMCIFIFFMAIGAIFGHIKISGSCGGLNTVTGDSCMFCKGEDECRHEIRQRAKAANIPHIQLKDYKPTKQ